MPLKTAGPTSYECNNICLDFALKCIVHCTDGIKLQCVVFCKMLAGEVSSQIILNIIY